jgi:profilin
MDADVGDSLVGSGHADKAAIVSAAGDSVWAKSANFEVRPGPVSRASRAPEPL